MFKLTKMSGPGFNLEAHNIEIIRDVLDLYICGMCKKNHGTWYDQFPNNYKELPVEDQVAALMATDCGCEFDFEDIKDGPDEVPSLQSN